MTGFVIHFRRLLPVVLLAGLTGCWPAESFDQSLGPAPDPGVEVSGDYRLAAIERVEPPAGGIDPVFTDGEIPETVAYETTDGRITRHRVLLDADLELRSSAAFRYVASYGWYESKSGFDRGPLDNCTVEIRGSYRTDGPTISLKPLFSDERIRLVQDASGAYRLHEMRNTCTGLTGGEPIESNILLQNLTFVLR